MDNNEHPNSQPQPEQSPAEPGNADSILNEIESGDDVLSIIADVESKLESIRAVQNNTNEQLLTLAERTEKLETAEAQIAEQSGKLQDAQHTLDRERQELTEEKAALESSLADLTQQREQVQAQQQELESNSQSLQGDREDLDRRTAELDCRQVEIDSKQARENEELNTLRSQCESLTQQGEQLQYELTQAREKAEMAERDGLEMTEQAERQRDEALGKVSELESARDDALATKDAADGQVKSLTKQVEQLQRELSEKESRLNDLNKKLELATQKLSQFSEAIQNQGEELERGAAARATVSEQQRTIKRLEQQVQESRDTFNGEMRKKDERIEELTRSLEAVDNESGGAETAEKDRRISLMKDELERLRAELQQRHEALEQVKNERHDDSEAQAEIESLRTKVNDLREQLSQAQKAADGDHAEMAANFKQKAQRIQKVAQHLKRRKERLGLVKKLSAQRQRKFAEGAGSSGGANGNTDEEMQTRARQIREMHKQRESLVEAQRCLADSEKKMIRRWARQRSIVVMFWFTLMTTGLAVGSWFLAEHWFPSPVTASVTVEARSRAGTTMSSEEVANWKQWHKNVLTDEMFLRSAAKRLDARGFDAYGSKRPLKSRLTRDLVVDTEGDEQIVLNLAGDGGRQTAGLLDVIATTLVIESNKNLDKRPGTARAAIIGERREPGRIRYASVNATTDLFNQDRMVHVGIIFAGLFTASLVTIMLIYTRLIKARRVFDEQEAALLSSSE